MASTQQEPDPASLSPSSAPAPAPAPASVTLPSTFHNSFWSTHYRTGFETVYDQLESSIVQSIEVLSTVRRRAQAELAFSHALTPPELRQEGFAANEGGSLRTGFEAILSHSVAEARARRVLAEDLERNIAAPFAEWSKAHQGRIASSRSLIESHLVTWEKGHQNVQKLKTQYDEACRAADEAEDELAHFKASPTPTSPRTEDKGKAKATDDEDAKSVEGADTIDDDDVPLGRATISALARRFTVRKTNPASSGGGSVEETLGSADPNVGAALDWSKATFSSLLERVAGPQTGEGRSDRARKHAEEVEKRYRDAVSSLDHQRLLLEEVLAEHLTYVQRCETDRLKAAASVLRSFHVAVAALPKLISGSLERVSSTLELLRPEKDVLGIIERTKTGPFQPRPITFHCHYSEPPTEVFGLDLRKYDETRRSTDPIVPPVLTFLLEHIRQASVSLPAIEKRKMWLYETPLSLQHRLRATLQASSDGKSFSRAGVAKVDLPVVASTVKLWLLELEIPPIVYSQYDELKHLYPKRVGSEIVDVPAKLLAEHLARMPAAHLETSRTMIRHFADLIESTRTDEVIESDEVYLQKLALSFARCLLRPKVETSLSIDDRFPALLFADLVKNWKVIFDAADELKLVKTRDERYRPRRQRTKPVDTRLSRSSIGVAEKQSVGMEEGLGLLKKQQHKRSPSTTVEAVEQQKSKVVEEEEVPTMATAATPRFESKEDEQETKKGEEGETTPTAPASKPLPKEVDEDAPVVRGSPSLSRSTRTKGTRGARPLSTASVGKGSSSSTTTTTDE